MREPDSALLQLGREQMRELGYRVVDLIVDHLENLPNEPAMRVRSREGLERLLREPLPRQGSAPGDVIRTVTGKVFQSIGHINHPRFFGFIPTPGNYVGVLADMLTAGYAPFCGTWLEGSGPAEIEIITLDWLKELFSFPESAGGLFLSGGSMANLTGLAAAREHWAGTDRQQHVFYCSDQTHTSVDRALRILGYRRDQICRLPSSDTFRLSPAILRSAIARDRAAGRLPAGVIVNVGSTNTGAIDPLPQIADVCEAEGLWLHADGAFGAAAIFSPRGKALLEGIDRVESLTLDPHKWLFQPYVSGCLLVRDPLVLQRAFHILPEYLLDAETHGREINFCDYGPELTRPFRALKLWMSLKVFGTDAFSAAVDRGIGMAEFAESVLHESAAWEIVSPAQIGIVVFRYVAGDVAEEDLDEVNRRLAHRAAEDGRCVATTTVLNGRTVLRMCTINPRTTDEDIRCSIETLAEYGEVELEALRSAVGT